MGSRQIDDFTVPWTADPSRLWRASAARHAAHLGADGFGMAITASAGSGTPSVEKTFAPVLDLTAWSELRFWLRSDRRADGSADRPFYLAFEAATDGIAPWRRLLPVGGPNWEPHFLDLGDMPAEIRRAVGVLRLRAAGPPESFTAAVDDLYACTPRAVQDVETALLSRLDRRFSVSTPDGAVAVPAVVNVPESPTKPAAPHILISPWAAVALTEHRGAEEIDNETELGAFTRPHRERLRLDYRIEVSATEAAQKAFLLEAVISTLTSDPRLIAGNEPLLLTPFEPGPLETGPLSPGRVALYYRVHAWFETGARVFRPRAVPFLLTGTSAEHTELHVI